MDDHWGIDQDQTQLNSSSQVKSKEVIQFFLARISEFEFHMVGGVGGWLPVAVGCPRQHDHV